jgi:hypothetical protein
MQDTGREFQCLHRHKPPWGELQDHWGHSGHTEQRPIPGTGAIRCMNVFTESVSSTSQLLSWGHHAEKPWRSSCLKTSVSDTLLFLPDILILRTVSTMIFAKDVQVFNDV